MNKSFETLERFGLTLQILKTALAAAISWFVATTLLHTDYPYFAALAAILTVQVSVADSVDKATQRIIGIVGGVLLSMLLGHWFKIGAVSIFIVILVGMAIAKALRMNPQIISQVAVSSFLVLAFGQNREGYAAARIIETIIGSAIAVGINALIVPQNAIPDVERSILATTKLGAVTLKSLNALLETTGERRKTGRTEVDALIKELDKCQQTQKLAEQSLKYNPLLTHKRTHLRRLSVSVGKLEHITVQVRGIRRSLFDLQLNKTFQQEFNAVPQLQHTISTTAECIAAFGETVVHASTANLAALARQVEEAQAQQRRCLTDFKNVSSPEVLRDLGSVLTDLNRILKETERQKPEADAQA